MHRDVTLVAIKSSNKLKYLKLEEKNKKMQKKLYSFKRSFQLGDKKYRGIYTLRVHVLPVKRACFAFRTCTFRA